MTVIYLEKNHNSRVTLILLIFIQKLEDVFSVLSIFEKKYLLEWTACQRGRPGNIEEILCFLNI